MSDPVAEPARLDLATEVAEIKTLLTRVLEGQVSANLKYEAMSERQAEVERRLEASVPEPMAAGAGPPEIRKEIKAEKEEDVETHEGSADTVRVATPWYTAKKGIVRDFRVAGSSADPVVPHMQGTADAPRPGERLDSTIPMYPEEPPYYRSSGPHPENLLRDLDKAGVLHQAEKSAPPYPVRYANYGAADRGITGIVVGDQAPFTYRLKIFDVKHVFLFLRRVEEYHQQYDVQVNLVSFIDQNILDAIGSNREHGRDLPEYISTWTPRQLRLAMCRYFTTFNYTHRDLCAIAQEVIEFPKVYLAGTQSLERKAIAQLAQVPIYIAALNRYLIFIEHYQLLPDYWPREKNPTWEEPRRLNEVLVITLREKASEAHEMLREDLYNLRKESIHSLIRALPERCTKRITDLNHAAIVSEALRARRPNRPEGRHDESRIPGKGKPWLMASKTSDAAKEANFSPRTEFPPRKLNAMHSDAESDLEDYPDTWSESPIDSEDVQQNANSDPEEELHNIQAAERKMTDRSKEPCHTYFFQGACTFEARGKACPYSHDVAVGQRAIESATANLRKLAIK